MFVIKPRNNPTREQISERVALIRRVMMNGTSSTVSARQNATTHGPGVRGAVWVSRITYSKPPETDISESVRKAIDLLGDGTERYRMPEVGELEAQWVGWRPGVDKNTLESSGNDSKKYNCLMREVKSDLTILYVYGGAFMLNGPHSCRSLCSALSHSTGGRCYTVRYRLAPQDPFPAAIVDTLHAYLTLLNPPSGSFHKPVPPASIVLAGDSAGACLVLSLIQPLLSLNRSHFGTSTPTILFHRRPTPLPLPADVAIVSPALDQTTSLPSWTLNAASDIFADQLPAITDSQLPCDIWPSHPPRGHPYAEPQTLLHPLASPCTARCWVGAPPMWIAMGGGERLLDAAKVVARDAANNGCRAQWVEWESMPHLWELMCKDWWQGNETMVQWAQACVKIAHEGSEFGTGGWQVSVDGEEKTVAVEALTTLTRDEMMNHMKRSADVLQVWTGTRVATGTTKSQL